MKKAGEVTRLLRDWSKKDQDTQNRLMELIYGELRCLAATHLRRERPNHTLQSSALVHETYLRLVDQKQVQWQNRAHFYAMASRMMRRILVNHARDRVCAKRGGGAEHLSLNESALSPIERPAECIAIDDALKALERVNPQQARVMELRYFCGLNRDEIAEVLSISRPTVARRMRVARAWLYRHFQRQPIGR